MKSDRVPARPVERDEVGLQLDQVARDEARGDTEIAQHLHQQPARIAARALARGQRVLRRLHAGFHADDVAGLALHPRVEVDDEVDGVGRASGRCWPRNAGSSGPAGSGVHVDFRGRRGCLPGSRTAMSRPTARRRSRTDCRPSCRRRGRPRSSIRSPARERRSARGNCRRGPAAGSRNGCRRDLQRMAEHLGARMRRGLQPDHLRAEHDRPVVLVMRQVIDGSENCHGASNVLGDIPIPTFSHVWRILQADIAVRKMCASAIRQNPLWLAER